jgi:hypothetical protein
VAAYLDLCKIKTPDYYLLRIKYCFKAFYFTRGIKVIELTEEDMPMVQSLGQVPQIGLLEDVSAELPLVKFEGSDDIFVTHHPLRS